MRPVEVEKGQWVRQLAYSKPWEVVFVDRDVQVVGVKDSAGKTDTLLMEDIRIATDENA